MSDTAGVLLTFPVGCDPVPPVSLLRLSMETTAQAPTLLLNLNEVATHLRCTRRSVERQIARRRLRVVRIGRAVRVEREELDRFIASSRDCDGR